MAKSASTAVAEHWTSRQQVSPHMLAEIFTNAHLLDFKNRNSWAGRTERDRRSSRAQRARPDLNGQRCCKLWLKLLLLLAKKT